MFSYLIAVVLLVVVIAVVSYKAGYAKKREIININVDKVKTEKENLEKQIAIHKERLEELNKQYADKESLMDISIAKERKLKVEAVNTEIENIRNEFNSQYLLDRQQLEEQIQEVKEELDRLQRQKSATVEALQREQQVKDNKDFYRIHLSKEDKSDIMTLSEVKNRLFNPRILAMLIWQTYIQKKFKALCVDVLPQDKVCGIYKITNTLDDKCYIGQARNMSSRWTQHVKASCGIDCPAGNKLYAAMADDGIDNFTFELIEECLPEELNAKEAYYIDLYNSVKFGYNSQGGAIGDSKD